MGKASAPELMLCNGSFFCVVWNFCGVSPKLQKYQRKHWGPGCLLLMNFYSDLLCDPGWYSLCWCFWVPTKISGLPYPERTMGTEMSGSLIGLIKGCVQFGFTLKRVLRCQTSLSSRSVCVCECALKESS